MRGPALFAALFLVLSFGAVADDAADSKAARSAFQKGQTEYNLGNYAEAAKQFEETYRIRPVPALLFNIAQCYRFIGNLEKAVQTYRAYLRNAPSTDKNIAIATELLEQVETALASKKKAEQSTPHGLAQPNSGETQTTTPTQPPSRPPAPPVVTQDVPTPVAPPPPPKPRGVVAFVTGGAAVVALGGGLYFGHKSGSTISSLQGGYHPTAEIDSQSAAAKSDASKATVMLVAGAILAVTTGVLFALRF